MRGRWEGFVKPVVIDEESRESAEKQGGMGTGIGETEKLV